MINSEHQQLIEDNERLLEKVARLERAVEVSHAQQAESLVLLEGMSASLQASTVEQIYQSVFSTLKKQTPFDTALLLTPAMPGTLNVAATSNNVTMQQNIIVDPLLKSVLTGPAKAIIDIQLLNPDWLPTLTAPHHHSALIASFSYKSSVCLLMLFDINKGAYLRKDAQAINRITGLIEQTLDQVEKRFIELEAQQLRVESERVQGNLLRQEKMASLGQLAAGIAHEINNPISFIGSNLQLMQTQVKNLYLFHQNLSKQLAPSNQRLFTLMAETYPCDFLESDFNELFNDCREGVERVSHIVKSLKTYCQANDSNWQLNNVCEGFSLTLKMLENQLKYNCVISEYHADIPDSYCINSELNQVYLNLLLNAVQSMHGHGEIIIRSYAKNNTIFIEVQDNGMGIAPSKINQIFDPFYTTKEVGQGTGLGLSISHAIVKKHQGEIHVKSKVNHGSTFTIALPVLSLPPT
ncbi:hypothetical protein J8L98_12695 [Pseudoalteromonas sp. MMG013]|uniref:sensor histidine kinase n=1 Tax=Pseudoalteromonas sp. MMG013 TaxID=2822687 RepID=UPI001B3705CC|nr:ATP-binding protein [Pseudoalteromonas sp. MMG013]MBQ4862546.1 hypothetical protein [Pseudoalteromonas sp. MMG013]